VTPISFYIPQDQMPVGGNLQAWPDCLPSSANTARSWVLQTYLQLREQMPNVRLCHSLPSEGILMAFRGSIPFHYKPPPTVLFVCVCGDSSGHPYAHLHIVQNPSQLESVPHAFFIPHWPSPNLLPREPSRGDTFVNVDYLGDQPNLDERLRSSEWIEYLAGLGCAWRMRGPHEWHDFRETDAVVAIRSFDQDLHDIKPASKLVNAWHAHVPAILGRESAYRALRQSSVDYIEASSFVEAKGSVEMLRKDSVLRRDMAENGRRRATEINAKTLTAQWREFFTKIALSSYERLLRRGPIWRAAFFGKRYAAIRWQGLKARVSR
jgi:hypothetical protein